MSSVYKSGEKIDGIGKEWEVDTGEDESSDVDGVHDVSL